MDPDTQNQAQVFADKMLEILKHEELFQLEEYSLQQAFMVLKPIKFISYSRMLFSQLYVQFELPKERRKFENFVGLKTLKHASVVISQYCPQGDENVENNEYYGVVVSITNDKITIQFQDNFCVTNTDFPFLLKVSMDCVGFKRMRKILNAIKQHTYCTRDVLEIRFGSQTQTDAGQETSNEIEWINKHLTSTQKNAVKFALGQEKLALIHGPPGTGKTTTLVEIVLQIVKAGGRVLICTPTNVALDNMVSKLSTADVKLVRIGKIARVSTESLFRYTLDGILSQLSESEQIHDVKSELLNALTTIKNCGEKKRNKLERTIHSLRHELSVRESKAQTDILKSCNVVCSTVMSSSSDGVLKHISGSSFDTVIIDESTQCTEPLSYIAMEWSKKIILAGDHCQLAPFVQSPKALEGNLDISFFQCIAEKYGDLYCIMLCNQFRMNSHIMNWVSSKFYGGKLVADPSVEKHLLQDLPGVEENIFTSNSLVFVDTGGCKFVEQANEFNSYENQGEANLAIFVAELLVTAGVKPEDIGIITPYKSQENLITQLSMKSAVLEGLEIHTVDAFQGREKEAIVFSCTRSNSAQTVGFMSDYRRVNVAISRSRRLFCLLGDSKTLKSDDLLSHLIGHIQENGMVQSGYEYLHEIDVLQKPKSSKKSHQRRRKKKNTSLGQDFSDTELLNDVDLVMKGVNSANSDNVCELNNEKYFETSQSASAMGLNIPSEEETSDVQCSETISLQGSNHFTGIAQNRAKSSKAARKKDVNKFNHDVINDGIDDKIIEQFEKLNKCCSAEKCKTRITTIFYDCQHCKKRYCIPHSLPEVHGCGAEAKKDARKLFTHPRPVVSEKRRADLEKKLNAKLQEKEHARKRPNKK